MKNGILLFLAVILFTACTNNNPTETVSNSADLEYFGEEISKDGAIDAKDFFNSFNEGDSLELKVSGPINEVCKKKGCWMSMKIGADEEMMVRFKDYGFFVPLNADGRMATIDGWAYKEVMSVESLKHYAFDAGDTEEEIAAITEPKVSYTFMAKGVIIE